MRIEVGVVAKTLTYILGGVPPESTQASATAATPAATAARMTVAELAAPAAALFGDDGKPPVGAELLPETHGDTEYEPVHVPAPATLAATVIEQPLLEITVVAVEPSEKATLLVAPGAATEEDPNMPR